MLPILFMAKIYAARDSTGVLLPILITGAFFAVALYRRHAQWWHIVRLLSAAGVGIVLGWMIMQRLPGESFRRRQLMRALVITRLDQVDFQ